MTVTKKKNLKKKLNPAYVRKRRLKKKNLKKKLNPNEVQKRRLKKMNLKKNLKPNEVQKRRLGEILHRRKGILKEGIYHPLKKFPRIRLNLSPLRRLLRKHLQIRSEIHRENMYLLKKINVVVPEQEILKEDLNQFVNLYYCNLN